MSDYERPRSMRRKPKQVGCVSSRGETPRHERNYMSGVYSLSRRVHMCPCRSAHIWGTNRLPRETGSVIIFGGLLHRRLNSSNYAQRIRRSLSPLVTSFVCPPATLVFLTVGRRELLNRNGCGITCICSVGTWPS